LGVEKYLKKVSLTAIFISPITPHAGLSELPDEENGLAGCTIYFGLAKRGRFTFVRAEHRSD
jgi:hypothetical protein